LVLALTIVLVSLAAILLFNQGQPEVIAPQPPTLHMMPGAQNVTGTAKATEAVSLAFANSEVKQYTDKGYQLYGVYETDNVYWVGILTNEQQLPWVLGISLNVPIQFNSSDPTAVNFELTLANLTQNQKEQTLQIARDTIKTYGGNASIDDVNVNSWTDSVGGKATFHAYPYVRFRAPQDFHKPGTDVAVYVDLQKGQIEKVWTHPSKPSL
jgi:hypothetical protein